MFKNIGTPGARLEFLANEIRYISMWRKQERKAGATSSPRATNMSTVRASSRFTSFSKEATYVDDASYDYDSDSDASVLSGIIDEEPAEHESKGGFVGDIGTYNDKKGHHKSEEHIARKRLQVRSSIIHSVM